VGTLANVQNLTPEYTIDHRDGLPLDFQAEAPSRFIRTYSRPLLGDGRHQGQWKDDQDGAAQQSRETP
jgi:hypothetical protein